MNKAWRNYTTSKNIGFILFALLYINCQAQPTIIVDAGHDPKFKGAQSSCGKYEYTYNDELVDEFAQTSSQKLWLTRENGKPPKGLADSDYSLSESLNARVTTLSTDKFISALFISIHHDSNSERFLVHDKFACKGRGGTVLMEEFKKNHKVGFNIFLYDDQSKRYFSSLQFAEILGGKLISIGRVASDYHTPSSDDCKSCRPININLGIWHQNVLVLRQNLNPSVLIEVGNLMDPEDERIINSSEFKTAFTLALEESIKEYLKFTHH